MLKKFKKLIEPIKYDKKNYFIRLLNEVFDSLQAIFMVQIVAFIIGAVEEGNIEKIYYYIWWWGLIAVLILINARISNITHDTAFIKIRSNLLQRYISNYVSLDSTKVETYGTGKITNLVGQGVLNWVGLILDTLVSSFVEILAIIYAFILISSQVPDWRYFLLFVVVFMLVMFFISWAFKIIHKYRKKVKILELDLDRHLVKVFMSKFEILQNSRISKEQAIIDRLMNEKNKIRKAGNHRKIALQNTGMAILSMLRIIIFIVVGVGVVHGYYNMAYFVLLIELIRVMNRYVWNIRNYMKAYTKAIVHVDKMRDFFDNIPSRDYNSGADFIYNTGKIEIKNLSFSYQSDDQETIVFDNLNLTFDGEKRIAFVGPSGGGKTTLTKLISGYVFPQKGEVLIDDQSFSDMNLTSYYKHIGYLTQEPNVFDGTIRENLLYGIQYEYNEKDKTFQKNIHQIIKKSRCEFIFDFKDGLDTEIGERGIRLSGGQKQRLAIAKIMLKNPKIILLDEPTSALDSIAEQKISEAFHNLFKGKTVIVVAHRLQTVKEADEIIVIDRGKVIERGTHEELKEIGGTYKDMLDLQTSF